MQAGNNQDHSYGKRVAAQVGFNHTSSRSKPKSVLMERSVNFDDLKDLKFEDRSLYTVFTERGWTAILEAKGKAYPDIVREFYNALLRASGVNSDMQFCFYVRDVRVVISRDEIASFLHLRLPAPRVEVTKSSQWSVDEIYRALTDTKDVYDLDDHDMDKFINHKDLLPFFQMLHLIVAANVTPTEDTTKLSIRQGKFLLAIARGVDIDLSNHIYEIIWGSADENELPYGVLITGLLLKAGVKIRSDEQEDQCMGPIRWTKPISQTGPEANKASSSEDHKRPSWFETMLSELDSRVAAHIAPIQSRLKDIEDRLRSGR